MSTALPKPSGCFFPLFGKRKPQEATNILPTGSLLTQKSPATFQTSSTCQDLQNSKLLIPPGSILEKSSGLGSIQEQHFTGSNLETARQPTPDEVKYGSHPSTPCLKPNPEAETMTRFTLTILGESPQPMNNTVGCALTVQKVDTTANEDCDVDVEEDIPFVAPELFSGIKALLARAQIEELQKKQATAHLTDAQRKLGKYYLPFMRAVAELERQTNRGFDWSTVVKPRQPAYLSPAKSQSSRLSESKIEVQELTSAQDVNPMNRFRTVRRPSIMPSVPAHTYKQQITVQDPLTVRQVHSIQREILADAKRDAELFGEDLNLSDMSFRR